MKYARHPYVRMKKSILQRSFFSDFGVPLGNQKKNGGRSAPYEEAKMVLMSPIVGFLVVGNRVRRNEQTPSKCVRR